MTVEIIVGLNVEENCKIGNFTDCQRTIFISESTSSKTCDFILVRHLEFYMKNG